jgi:hypothetical protein
VIVSKALRGNKQRVVSVAISCPQAAGVCDGRLKLSVGATKLGAATFLVNGGKHATIRIKVTAKSLKAAIKKKVTVAAISRDNAGAAAFTTQIVAFRK